jgi:hypothetical protein
VRGRTIFEVNGGHNVVHIASGLFLRFMRRHDTARLAALSFGAIYGVVTIIGLPMATTSSGYSR